MSSNPFFTIIIPTFNSARSITACLQSVAGQIFTDFEILIQDGISKDGTLQIANAAKVTDARVKVFSEKDSGIYDAMNKAVANSTGQWLYFLGSDDKLYDENVLKDVAGFIKSLPEVDVVYGNVWSNRFNGAYDGAFNANKLLKKNISHQAIFFKRSVFEKTGMFDCTYKAQADWDHNLKWMLMPGIRYHFIDRLIAYYADGGFSSVNGDDKFYRDLRLKFLEYGKYTLPLHTKASVFGYEFLKLVRRADSARLKQLWELFKSKR